MRTRVKKENAMFVQSLHLDYKESRSSSMVQTLYFIAAEALLVSSFYILTLTLGSLIAKLSDKTTA